MQASGTGLEHGRFRGANLACSVTLSDREDGTSDLIIMVPTAFHLAAFSCRGRVAHDDKPVNWQSAAFGRPAASSSRFNLDTMCRFNLDTMCRWTVFPGSSGAERQLRGLALLLAGQAAVNAGFIHEEAGPVQPPKHGFKSNRGSFAGPPGRARVQLA